MPVSITHLHLMHATPAARPHSRPGWIYELKYDGFPVLAIKAATRSGCYLAAVTTWPV